MKHITKLKRGILVSTILFVLTLSFAQITSYDPVIMRGSFTIADQENLPTRGNMGMVYDNESDQIVIFGGWNNTPGEDPYDSTWSYDYNSDWYTELSPAVSPPGRAEPGLTYDSNRDQIILFGGEDTFDTANILNDTWLFDVNTNTWTEVFPTTAPSDGRGHTMAFDSESDRVIFFGGYQGGESLPVDETWAYNPGTNVWQMMSPTTAPGGRYSHSMVYDSESDKVILFGGHDGGSPTSPSNYFGDTWAYNFNSDTWENLTTTGNPSVRAVPSLAYDSESDRIVLFGGSMFVNSYDDTWLFDYNTLTWEEMSPTTSPSERSRHGSAYDWESDQVIIYGGTSNGFNGVIQIGQLADNGKTWAYDVNTNTWVRKDQPPPPITDTTTTTTNGPPPPPPGGVDWLLVTAVASVGVVLILVIFFVRRR
ncbi:MAG: Kelch repeat-containing protein [Candidatus Thorarchaeota archaeon]